MMSLRRFLVLIILPILSYNCGSQDGGENSYLEQSSTDIHRISNAKDIVISVKSFHLDDTPAVRSPVVEELQVDELSENKTRNPYRFHMRLCKQGFKDCETLKISKSYRYINPESPLNFKISKNEIDEKLKTFDPKDVANDKYVFEMLVEREINFIWTYYLESAQNSVEFTIINSDRSKLESMYFDISKEGEFAGRFRIEKQDLQK